MKLSMGNRILLPILLVIAITMAASSLITYMRTSDSLREMSTDRLVQSSKEVAQIIDWWIQDRRQDVANWSEDKMFNSAVQDSFVGKSARGAASEQLTKIKANYPYYEDLNLLDLKGDIVASSNSKLVGKINVASRGYFKDAVEKGAAMSSVISSKATGKPVFVLAKSIKVKDQVAGVFMGVVDLASFNAKFVDNRKIGNTGYAFLFDGDGRVIAYPDASRVLKLNLKEFDFGKEMLAKGSGVLVYTFEGVEKVVAFEKSSGTGWTVATTIGTEELLAAARETGYISLIIGIVSILLAALVIFFVTRSIMKPLNASIDGLGHGADQVAGAAQQVARASQQLANGSSQQASALEESSASLEEMASMTRQNAESARQADTLMHEASAVVEQGGQTMTELTGSMKDIAEASQKTAGIIKTIDEIAFQTNLLALNAAVEAARAGEAGAGFAVVADEVRNLAMRAAEAAKNTAELIEGTVKRVESGNALVQKTAQAFEQITSSTSKVGDLVGEIASASHEQSQGIDQVNKAVTEMEQLTQGNAANAEETAAASEEMSAQSEYIREHVAKLVALTSGSRKHAAPAASPQEEEPAAARKKPAAKKLLSGGKKAAPQAKAAKAAKAVPGKQSPAEAIPFDEDEDFTDF